MFILKFYRNDGNSLTGIIDQSIVRFSVVLCEIKSRLRSQSCQQVFEKDFQTKDIPGNFFVLEFSKNNSSFSTRLLIQEMDSKLTPEYRTEILQLIKNYQINFEENI